MEHTKQLLRVAEIETVAPYVNRYRFTAAQGAPAPFLPGQFLCLYYEIDGATAVRPYSIASSPKEAAQGGYYDLFIHVGGSFTSRWLGRHITVGDTVMASHPLGEFCICPQTPQKIVGISGGMSVTPLRSMVRSIVDESTDREITLFCGWDTSREVLFREEFMQLARKCSRVHVQFSLVQDPQPGDKPGYFTSQDILRETDAHAAAYYLCGPQEMYHSLHDGLIAGGVTSERYHQEIPGELHSPDYATAPAEQYPLTIQTDSGSITVTANANESVLVALERAGLSPRAYCRSGSCGFCRSLLLEGQVWTDPGRAKPPENSVFHPCCSFPRSALTVALPK